MQSDSRLSALEEDILTALGGNRLYGLELLELINSARFPFDFNILGVGSIYPALTRLVQSGLLDREEEDRKVFYELTYEGHKALSQCQFYRSFLTLLSEETERAN